MNTDLFCDLSPAVDTLVKKCANANTMQQGGISYVVIV